MFLSKKEKARWRTREKRNLLYKKAKKLEVRECVVCFFLVFESI